MYQLVIGDKNWSSWSLRPWLAMRQTGLPFREINVALRTPDTRAQILAHSPSGKVPALKTAHGVIWDSLAIIEYLAERHPETGLWPDDPAVRALARAVSAEMHSGFYALRSECPMDILNVHAMPTLSTGAETDIRRIAAIWTMLREANAAAGPFLCGHFTAVDAMFAPVVTRFITYSVPLADFGAGHAARDYCATIMALPAMQDWCDGAAAGMAARAV